MEIHYFAAARAAAGVNAETVPAPAAGTTVGELLDSRAAELRGATDSGMTLADILPRCTFLVDGANTSGEKPVDGARRIDVLPPFAGG